jgi:hypothetical protein
MNKVELYHIDAGIPIPSKESKYSVLGRLKVGESVLFNVPRSASLSPAIHRIQLKDGKRFTRKAVEGGVRVWRVAIDAKLTTEPPITPRPRKRKPKEQPEEPLTIASGTTTFGHMVNTAETGVPEAAAAEHTVREPDEHTVREPDERTVRAADVPLPEYIVVDPVTFLIGPQKAE